MMKIFVDDIRTPVGDDWILARNIEQAKNLISKSIFHNDDLVHISLDHDLGDDETTRELLRWLSFQDILFQYGSVHSANPVGAQWLKMALEKDFSQPIPIVPAPSYF